MNNDKKYKVENRYELSNYSEQNNRKQITTETDIKIKVFNYNEFVSYAKLC